MTIRIHGRTRTYEELNARIQANLNTALHGAGSAIDTGAHNVPKLPHPESRRAYAGVAEPKPASDAQIKFIRDLCAEMPLSPEQLVRVEMGIEAGLTSPEASEKIEKLIALRDRYREARSQQPATPVAEEPPSDLDRVVKYLRGRMDKGTINEFGQSLLEQYEATGSLSSRQIAACLKGMPRVEAPPARTETPKTVEVVLPGPSEVPAGRYAVEAQNGELTFYCVVRGKNNPEWVEIWLKRGPNASLVPWNPGAYRTILLQIWQAGPGEAARRYGRELGKCSRCNMDLTNRLSRELAIGPICGGHFYDKSMWKTIKADARAAIRARGEDPDENVEV